jgi:hypothetical protein
VADLDKLRGDGLPDHAGSEDRYPHVASNLAFVIDPRHNFRIEFCVP